VESKKENKKTGKKTKAGHKGRKRMTPQSGRAEEALNITDVEGVGLIGMGREDVPLQEGVDFLLGLLLVEVVMLSKDFFSHISANLSLSKQLLKDGICGTVLGDTTKMMQRLLAEKSEEVEKN